MHQSHDRCLSRLPLSPSRPLCSPLITSPAKEAYIFFNKLLAPKLCLSLSPLPKMASPPPPPWHQHPVAKSILSCPGRCCACCGSSCTKFKAFVAKGSVVDLAVAVIIGNSFQQIVKAFTDGIVTPLIAAATPSESNSTDALVGSLVLSVF